MTLRQAALEKTKEVEEINNLIKHYKVLGVASLQKVRAPQLQELRRKLADSAQLRVTKNTIVKRAIGKCKDKPRLESLEEHLTGPNIFLFTNLNPFKLALLLHKSRVKTTAKAGDTAAEDVIVPAGNTGLPPGPIISQFSAVGLPTRIEAGSVWINRDTLVAKKQDVIEARLASVLSKLGLKPVEAGLIMKAAYDNGLIITQSQMQLNLEEIQQNITEALSLALNLSLNTTFPTPENMKLLLKAGHHQAYSLALESGSPTSDTIADLIRRAHNEMLRLRSRLDAKS